MFKPPGNQIQPDCDVNKHVKFFWFHEFSIYYFHPITYFHTFVVLWAHIERIFYLEIPKEYDPNYLSVWTLQGQSKDNWVSFGVGIPAPQHRHSGAFPVQLQCTLQTWNGLQIGEAALVSSLLLAFVAQSSSKWLWH